MTGGDLLVAAPTRWDEACFAVPALRALVASGMDVGVMACGGQEEFWATLAGLRLVLFPEKTKARRAADAIRGQWKASLVWEEGFAADATRLAGIERRLGPAAGRLAKRLTHPLAVKVGPLEHRVRFYLTALEEMGVPTGRPEFFAPAALGVEAVESAVLLCPDSDFGASHEWPLDRWETIARRLADAGRRLTIAGLPGGRGLGKSLAVRIGGVAEFFDAAPLSGALPLLAVHGRVIAADGSLPHLAAHAGSTCVTLFGPNDPAWKRPLGRRHSVVKRHVECAPCLLAKCPLDMRCQKELDVERVWAAAVSDHRAGNLPLHGI
jgi:ADP-heptose:LPS heptosyltransferase